MTSMLIAFAVSVSFVLFLLPLFARGAKWVGLVDRPDKQRKLHENEIPLIGGVAVFVGASVGFGCALWFGSLEFREQDPFELIGLLIGTLVILAVGILDDRFALRGRQKLFGQIIAATVLLIFGYRFFGVAFSSVTIQFGVFWFLVVYAWVLAAINSVNLLDGADGFASTVGIVVFISLAIMAGYNGDYVDAVICAAFAGALIGFLRYNFPPAKVFLGDAGSMLIGFVLAAITIRSQFKQATAYAFFAPIALLGIPLIDTGAAILRRRLTGRSIYTTDRGHLHHTMAKKGLGPRTSLLWVGFLTATTATGGLLSVITKQSEFAILSVGIVVLVLMFGRIFGIAEFELVSRRALGILGSFVKPSEARRMRQSTVQLQGHRDWKSVWEQLCEFADENDLHEITLDVNAPWIHESFHATRRLSKGKHDAHEEWQSEVPLIADGRIFGKISFSAPVIGRFTHQDVVANVIKISSDVEFLVCAIADDDERIVTNEPESNDDENIKQHQTDVADDEPSAIPASSEATPNDN